MVLSHGLNIRVPAATADVAVQTFYLVSGFYMGMVLTEKYHYLPSFFINRFVRLYPAYFVVLLITAAHSAIRWQLGRSAVDPGLVLYETHFQPLDLVGKAYLVGTNLLLWGQDVAPLPGAVRRWALARLHVELHGDRAARRAIPARPASVVALDRNGFLPARAVAGPPQHADAGGRRGDHAGSADLARIARPVVRPLDVPLFPVEIGAFVLGVLTHRSMGHRTASRPLQCLATAGLLLLSLTLSAIPGGWTVRVVFYAYCAWALPLAFQLTKRSRIDRYLGELSYPIYLSHLLVISVALYSGWTGTRLALLIVVLVLGASIALHEVVQRPVDRLRARWVA